MGKDMVLVILWVWIIIQFALNRAAPQTALVTELPGFNGTFPSKHYAGYIRIGDGDLDNLFYYFIVSERNPSKDPVVLWLNGGPGCSSFDGFIYEHGPFNFQANKEEGKLPTLHLNPYSWSKVSNIIYLDSPTGVGFSYSKNTTEYITGDLKTANHTHQFLLKWFEQYPEFQLNPFYVTGESYAGVYVPTLAAEIVKGIHASVKPVINLKGYMIGNGVTDEKFDGNALVPFVHGMGLISDTLYEEVKAACGGYYYRPINSDCSDKMMEVYGLIDDLNIYDILEPCYHSPSENTNTKLPSSFRELGVTNKSLAVRKRIFGRAWPFFAPIRPGIVPMWPHIAKGQNTYVPCTDDEFATSWLNNERVRKAIHDSWELCSDNIVYDHNAGSMLSYHKNLTMQGYRALIYSGDHDMCVPFTGSEAWTKSMGYKIVEEWRPWLVNQQVAGYLEAYDRNLTFLTIKGAGHTVPEYKPREALAFYSCWLDETKF
ncbi:serine carboxypeptidase-like 20 [Carica papaya]|uniref:serine carboxypeptidase-like 20 n=1 Tax=Carica papaya TaxID=3649 RepID=UPI000B8D0147|nr:serine carboxypeptidase-like 20 [Carica papaya]